MPTALEPDFILRNATARTLYEGDGAKGLRRIPIIDVHTHADGAARTLPDNAWDLLVAPDHYKTQMMYLNGHSVTMIEGSDIDRQANWRAFAEIFHQSIGTIVYDSTMAILRRLFEWTDPLNAATADAVWDRIHDRLTGGAVTMGSIINGGDDAVNAGNVEVIATCDNPWLEDPAALTKSIDGVQQVPFRLGMRVEPIAYPQKFARIGGDNDPVLGMSRITGVEIDTIADYIGALEQCVRDFAQFGNTSLDFSMWGDPLVYPVDDARATEILRKARDTHAPDPAEERDFLAYILPHFFRLAYQQNIPLQLKVGALREVNPYAPVNAHDGVDPALGLNGLVPLFREYEQKANAEGKDWTVVLSVRNRQNYQQQADLASTFRIVYWGGDWWDNDNVEGMMEGLTARARWRNGIYRGVMFFSDTRSFPDCVTRFDMKKRVLANYLADLVDSRMVGYDDAFRLGRDAFYTLPKALFHV